MGAAAGDSLDGGGGGPASSPMVPRPAATGSQLGGPATGHGTDQGTAPATAGLGPQSDEEAGERRELRPERDEALDVDTDSVRLCDDDEARLCCLLGKPMLTPLAAARWIAMLLLLLPLLLLVPLLVVVAVVVAVVRAA